MILAEIINGASVLKLVLAALVAGVGITATFAVVIYGATRAGDMRRAARGAAAGGYAALAVVALAGCAAIIAYGLVLTVSKPS